MTKLFQARIEALKEEGIFSEIELRHRADLNRLQVCHEDKRIEVEPIGFMVTSPAFYILIGGTIISMISILLEQVQKQCMNQEKQEIYQSP